MADRLRVLVVTERFPPEIAGGGEISLATALDAMPPGEVDLGVVSFTDAAAPVADGGSGVERLPVATAWPPTTATRRRGPGLAWALLRYLVEGRARGPRRRLELLGLRTTLRLLGQESFFPFQDADLLAQEDVVTAVRERIVRFQADVVHADNQLAILVVAAAAPSHVPLVGMVRDNRFFCGRRDQRANIAGIPCTTCVYACVEPLPRPLRKPAAGAMAGSVALRRRALERLDRGVVPSRYLARQLAHLCPDLAVDVVPNPMTVSANGSAAPIEPRLLAVGTVTAAKGQTLLIEMLPRLLATRPELRLELVGRPNPELEALLDRAAALGVRDAVDTPGYLTGEALAAAFSRARVVAVPGHYPEGFGRVAVEAALHGRPVVAFRIGAAPETIVDGETGRLIDPGDETGFERAVTELLDDPGRAAALGCAARHCAIDRYTPSAAAAGLLASWRRVTDGATR